MTLSVSEQQQLIAAANAAVARFARLFAAKIGNKDFFTREDMEDMAATAVMKACGAMDRYDPERATLATWVGRIAANCVKDAVDYKMKRLCISAPMYTERNDEEGDEFGADEYAHDAGILDRMSVNDTDSRVLQAELQERINDEVAKMTDKRKRIARMLNAGYSPQEMAEAEGCTTTAVYMCIWNIRETLRHALEEWNDVA